MSRCSLVDIRENLNLYTSLRYVDELPNQGVESYLAVDLSLEWRPREALSTSLTVRNLNDDRHREFTGGTSNEIERSALIAASWSF